MVCSQTPEDGNEVFQQILAHYHQSEQARLAQAKTTLRTEILPVLVQHRVANVEAAYSGYGDSGVIDGVQYRGAAGQRIEREVIPAALTEQLENVLYEFLPAGFEINDGGQGTLTIDTQTAKVFQYMLLADEPDWDYTAGREPDRGAKDIFEHENALGMVP